MGGALLLTVASCLETDSTEGAITLSKGFLGLADTGATTTHFTIGTTDGNDGRTIKMTSGDSGSFSAASSAGTHRIIIGAQEDGGIWDRGVLISGSNYSITADAAGASAFAGVNTFTIGDNSGLIGLGVGSDSLPTTLTLGKNSSFFVASSTAGARTYHIGASGGGNDIIASTSGTSTGSVTFGVNNTDASNAQIIHWNQDKSDYDVTLVSNGASTSSAVHISRDQTGSGDFRVLTRNLTLDEGVTFGGTGGIYQSVMSNYAGNYAGADTVSTVFHIKGTLNGTNTVYLGPEESSSSSFVVGSTATIGGTQTWTGGQTLANRDSAIFANHLTDASRWANGSVSLNVKNTGGTLEASTSTVAPSTEGNYQFNALSISPTTNSGGIYKLVNAVQNDGGSGKEAFYAKTFTVTALSDEGNGKSTFNFNGQDFYVDRLSNVSGLHGKGERFKTTPSVRSLNSAGLGRWAIP